MLSDESVPQPERVAAGARRRHRRDDGQVRGPGGGDPLRPRPAGHRRARACALRRVVRDVSALIGNGPREGRHLQGRRSPAALRRLDGLRRALPAADPSDRPQLPQGEEQHARSGTGRRRQPLGDRGRGGRPRCRRAVARHHRRLRPLRRGSGPLRHRDRARPRLSGVARSSVRQGTSRLVQAAARRNDQIRGEPAEEVSGHLPDQLRVERVGRRCGRS